MKKIILTITFLGILFGAQFSFAQDQGKITVDFKAINTIAGYDNLTKAELYCDGKLLATSSEMVQSQLNTVSADAPLGKHSIHLLLYAYYDGSWEVRTIANDYSMDWEWKGDVNIKKKTAVKVLFDVAELSAKKVKKF
jgi:hypothetical protein